MESKHSSKSSSAATAGGDGHSNGNGNGNGSSYYQYEAAETNETKSLLKDKIRVAPHESTILNRNNSLNRSFQPFAVSQDDEEDEEGDDADDDDDDFSPSHKNEIQQYVGSS